jgi:hypothetical protein
MLSVKEAMENKISLDIDSVDFLAVDTAAGE